MDRETHDPRDVHDVNLSENPECANNRHHPVSGDEEEEDDGAVDGGCMLWSTVHSSSWYSPSVLAEQHMSISSSCRISTSADIPLIIPY